MICELCGERDTRSPDHTCEPCTALFEGAPAAPDPRAAPGSGAKATAPPAAPDPAPRPTAPQSGGLPRAEGLAGRRAVVTGGNRGIGRAIAERLMALGAGVHIVDLDDSNLAALRAFAAEHDVPCSSDRADITDVSAMEAMAGRLAETWGAVDILVNNAGVFHAASFYTHPKAHWDHQLAVNVTGAFIVTQALLPLMPERAGSRIVNIASVAGKTGAALAAGYIASKHAIVGLTRAVALELAPVGINVNAIAPGFVDTDMLRQITEELAQLAGHNDPERSLQELLDDIPQQRLLQPEEIAELAAYLASDASAGMTGQVVTISGGWLLS